MQNNLTLPGLLNVNDSDVMPAVSYAQLVSRISVLRRATNNPIPPSDDTIIAVQIDGVTVTTITLPRASVKQAFVVALALPAESVLSISVTQTGGAAELAVWFELVSTATGEPDTWFVPDAGKFLEDISAAEYKAFTSAATTGGVDRIPGLINDTVAEIRTAIRSGHRNNLGRAGTIPSGAAHIFMHICKWHFFDYVKSVSTFAEKSEKAKTQAEAELERIATGKINFQEPLTIGEAVAQQFDGGSEPRLEL